MYKSFSEGFYLVDKPANKTSFDIVAKIKKQTNEKKVGHAGTLDPFATGLLIIAVGREYTKKLNEFQKLDKEYFATILLGFSTDTDDLTGVPITKKVNVNKSDLKIKDAVKKFIGNIEQIPSTVSAKKINGQRAYKLHRQGKKVILKPVSVEIYDIKIKKIIKRSDGCVTIDVIVKCSTGTYIRALARDIGNILKVGGHLIALKRTKIGNFSVDDPACITELTY